MRRVRVKICGVRTLEEAQAALDHGADALGFNFWNLSPRYITPEAAREIIAKLPPFISCIGVFVNELPDRVKEIASSAMLDAVQLSGEESPEYCEGLYPARVIKGLRVGGDFDLAVVQQFSVSAVLLDASVGGMYGGTGRQFDWRIAVEAKRFAPIILAGGLTTENVAEAITCVMPMAIDVCSGIEAEPGRKDIEKLRKFMAAVDRANALMEGGAA